MSAFLGPIHFWVYNKIQLQQGIVDELIELGRDQIPSLGKELDTRYGASETKPLDEVIDAANIHGWLQTNVTRAEYKLAYSVTALIATDPDILKDITSIFMEKGKSASISETNAAKAYKLISDNLLDGMPCDHANIVLEESDEKVVWKRNTCVHKNYWEEIGGDIDIYYSLREAFIHGFLMDTTLNYKKIDEVTNTIRKESK